MVKLARGGRRHCGPGRQEPVPLFPPGDLPVFGPPPVNMRRPLPPPRGLPPLPPHGYAPPLPRPMPPPRMRPPPMHLAPPPFPPVCRRPGPPPPPPLRPLLQSPLLPPRPLPFMRGGRGPMPIGRNGPNMKRLGKNMKKGRNKKTKGKLDNKQPDANAKKNQSADNNDLSSDIINGPWITDVIKSEIEKMKTLKKEAEEKKDQEKWNNFNEQKKRVESMATAAKMEYIGSQPDGDESSVATKNGTAERKENITVRSVTGVGTLLKS